MINVAIIGAGHIGTVRANVISRSNKSRIVAVSDVNFASAEKLGVPATTEEIFNRKDINAVIVATPTKFHMPLVVAALKAGKHVLCEKPLGRNVEEAKEIYFSISPGRILHSGFNYRHLSHVLAAKKMLEEDVIGDLLFFRSRFGNGGRPGYENEWCTQKDLSGGGVVIEQAIHVFDLIPFLFGEPKRIVAKTNTCYHNFTDTEDNVFCLLETSHGTAMTHVSWTQWANFFEVEIFGSKGYLRLSGRDGSYGPPKLYYGIKNVNHSRPTEHEIILAEDHNSWMLDWAEFESEIETGQDNGSAYAGLQAQRVAAAVYKSVKFDRWVAMDENL